MLCAYAIYIAATLRAGRVDFPPSSMHRSMVGSQRRVRHRQTKSPVFRPGFSIPIGESSLRRFVGYRGVVAIGVGILAFGIGFTIGLAGLGLGAAARALGELAFDFLDRFG